MEPPRKGGMKAGERGKSRRWR